MVVEVDVENAIGFNFAPLIAYLVVANARQDQVARRVSTPQQRAPAKAVSAKVDTMARRIVVDKGVRSSNARDGGGKVASFARVYKKAKNSLGVIAKNSFSINLPSFAVPAEGGARVPVEERL